MGGNNKFIDKFSNVAMRVGGQIHLKALRDTFATIMPLYILARVAVLGHCHYKWYIKYLRITCSTDFEVHSGTIKKSKHKFIRSYLFIQLRKLLIYIRYLSDSYFRISNRI